MYIFTLDNGIVPSLNIANSPEGGGKYLMLTMQ